MTLVRHLIIINFPIFLMENCIALFFSLLLFLLINFVSNAASRVCVWVHGVYMALLLSACTDGRKKRKKRRRRLTYTHSRSSSRINVYQFTFAELSLSLSTCMAPELINLRSKKEKRDRFISAVWATAKAVGAAAVAAVQLLIIIIIIIMYRREKVFCSFNPIT